MKKSVTVNVRGDFNEIEFENLMCDKIRTYNLEKKPVKHVDITGTVDSPGDGLIQVIAEGEEDDLEFVVEIAKRGPVVSHIIRDKVITGKYTGKYNVFSKKVLLSIPKKRILF